MTVRPTVLYVVAAALVAPGQVLATTVGDEAASTSAEAQEEYEVGNYVDALRLYRDAQLEDPDSGVLHFNVGDALYKTGDYQTALNEFLRSTGGEDADLQAQAWYNAGNSHFELQQYADAAKAFKEALARSPDDADAKANLELALQKLQEQPQQQREEGDDQQKLDDEQRSDDRQSDDGAEQEQEESTSQQPEEGGEDGESSSSTPENESGGDDEGTEAEPESRRMNPEEAEQLLEALKEAELDAQHRRFRMKPGRQAKDW